MLIMFIIIFFIFLSGITTTISIKCFPNQKIAELERQNKSLSNHIARLDKRIVMLYEKNQIREAT